MRKNENLQQFFKRKLDKGKSNLFQAALKYIPESFYLIFEVRKSFDKRDSFPLKGI